MYYCYRMKLVCIDELDYFLMGLCIASYLTRKYCPTLIEQQDQEKQKLIKLAWSLMKKSKIKLKGRAKLQKLQTYEMRFLKLRGGDFTSEQRKAIIKAARQTKIGKLVGKIYEELRKEYGDQEYLLALKLKEAVVKILCLVKYKEIAAGLAQEFKKQFVYSQISSLLCKILGLFQIRITYALQNVDLSPKSIVISVMAGAATGFAASWIPFLRVLVGTNLVASSFLLRNVVQQSFESIQWLSDWAYKRKIQKLLDNCYSADKIIVGPGLELESNTAEVFNREFKMPAFEKTPVDKFEIDQKMKDLFEKLSLPDPLKDIPGRTPMNQRPRPPRKEWAKMVTFSDFIRENEVREGLEVINEQIK